MSQYQHRWSSLQNAQSAQLALFAGAAQRGSARRGALRNGDLLA